MAKGQECPVCGHYAYHISEGEYDREEWGQGAKLTPDEGRCNYCGFMYSEHCRHPEEEQAKDYLKILKKKGGRR